VSAQSNGKLLKILAGVIIAMLSFWMGRLTMHDDRQEADIIQIKTWMEFTINERKGPNE